MEKIFAVQNDFSGSVSRYLAREAGKGKDIVRTMDRLMGYWLLNAMKNIKSPKSSRDQIRAYLMQKVRNTPMPATRRKRAAVVDEMRNTMAMMIVAAKNIKGARTAKGSQGYKIARNFRNQSVFSSGYIKSGFLPGLRKRRAGTDGSTLPRYGKYPGDSPDAISTPDEISMRVTNFAQMSGELFPGAFDEGLVELNARTSQWLLQDLLNGQNNAGLNSKRA